MSCSTNDSAITGRIRIRPITIRRRRPSPRLTRSTAVRSFDGSVILVSPIPQSRERRRAVDRADLVHHRLVAVEAALLVAAKRMLGRTQQALVAMRAWALRQVVAVTPVSQQVVVRHQRAGDRDGIEVTALEVAVDHAAGLPTAGADHRDVDRLL